MIDHSHLLLLSVRRQRKAEAGQLSKTARNCGIGYLRVPLPESFIVSCRARFRINVATAQVQQPTNHPARFVPGASYIDYICDRNAHRLVKALAGLCYTLREPQHQLCAATAEPSDRHEFVQINAMLDAVFVLRS